MTSCENRASCKGDTCVWPVPPFFSVSSSFPSSVLPGTQGMKWNFSPLQDAAT